jgi:hypothetical protein
VLSSHFSPGFAPHLGQRSANSFFGLTFTAYTMRVCSPIFCSIVTITQSVFVEYWQEANLNLSAVL